MVTDERKKLTSKPKCLFYLPILLLVKTSPLIRSPSHEAERAETWEEWAGAVSPWASQHGAAVSGCRLRGSLGEAGHGEGVRAGGWAQGTPEESQSLSQTAPMSPSPKRRGHWHCWTLGIYNSLLNLNFIHTAKKMELLLQFCQQMR